MSQQDILNCSFPLWFKHFQEHTIDSDFIKIPQVFIDYLLADGLFLPDDHLSTSSIGSDTDDGEEINETSEEVDARRLFASEEFVTFKSLVVSAITELGGKVFPKLNWSSPKDASWIAVNNSLCCETFNDICLLLKSSEYIVHDLIDPFLLSKQANRNSSSKSPINYVLVLRKWLDVCPSGEYRCFVKDTNLVAITQRSTQHFSFIESQKSAIVRNINRFYKRIVQGKFPNDSYVFDIYIAGDNETPTLIDFNPYVSITEGILFSWEELEEHTRLQEISSGESIQGIVFRSIPPGGLHSSDLRSNAYPIDFQHLSTGEDPAKLIDLLKLHQRTNSSSSNDTD